MAAKRKAKAAGRRKAAAKKPAAKKKKATARKAVPKKAVKAKRKAAPQKKKQVVGEGDYRASRAFLKDQAGFVKRNKAKISAMGEAAGRALEGPEGEALRAAEDKARRRGAPDQEAAAPGAFVIPPG